MATEVLLMTDVKDLGNEGDVVTVADGFARNYLFPRAMGAAVNAATRRQLVKIQAVREADRKEQIAQARKQAAKLAGISCTIAVKTDGEDKMYGSVAAKDILDALKVQGIEIDKHSLNLEHPIKELGVFDVMVKLDKEVETAIKVWVVEE